MTIVLLRTIIKVRSRTIALGGGEIVKEAALHEQLNRYYQLWCDATQLYEKWSKQRGITYNYVLTLCTLLSNQEHCTQKIICDQWGLPKQTVNTILKDFEKKGYVTLASLPTDKRNKLILLTDEGRKYANEIATTLMDLDIYAIEKMGIERMKYLNDSLALYLEYFREAERNNGTKQ